MSAIKDTLACLTCPVCGNDGRTGAGIRLVEAALAWRQVLGENSGLLEIEAHPHLDQDHLDPSSMRFLCLGMRDLTGAPCHHMWTVPHWLLLLIRWV